VLIAASFVGAVAWAQATGRRPRLFERRAPEPTARSAEAPSHASKGSTAGSLRAEPVAEAPLLSEEADAGTDPPSASKEEPSLRPVVRAPSRAPAPVIEQTPATETRPAEEAVDLDGLYRVAHEAHFVKREPAAALAAWDAYLHAAGASGRFSIEARYYRALSLIRLGKEADARAALEPFARGEYGEYRRADAHRLLESLR
jgi:hypothetical protein